jgi:hypothetical protein
MARDQDLVALEARPLSISRRAYRLDQGRTACNFPESPHSHDILPAHRHDPACSHCAALVIAGWACVLGAALSGRAAPPLNSFC